MQKTLGNLVEDWAIQALKAAATLPYSLQIRPYNATGKTNAERLVIKAEVGERLEEGQKPYVVALEIAFHTTKRSAEQADALFAKVEACLVAPATSDYVNANFTWLLVRTEEAKTTLENTPNFRVYKRTIPLQALGR